MKESLEELLALLTQTHEHLASPLVRVDNVHQMRANVGRALQIAADLAAEENKPHVETKQRGHTAHNRSQEKMHE